MAQHARDKTAGVGEAAGVGVGADIRNAMAVFIAAVLCYLHTLNNEFTFDDHLAIEGNGDISPNASISGLLKHDIWGKDVSFEDSHKSYRPLLVLLFRLCFSFCSYSFDPRCFRPVNFVLHGLSSTLVYSLCREIFLSSNASLFGALLFAVHAVHVEAVASAVNVSEPLCCVWYIAAFLCYKRAQRTKYTLWSFVLGAITCILIWVAALCKETGVTFCGVVLTLECLEFLLQPRPAAHNGTRTFLLVTSTVVCSLSYCLLRIKLMATTDWRDATLERSRLIRRTENPFAFLKGKERYLSIAYLHARYLWLLIWPAQLSAEYSYNCIPAVQDFHDPRNIGSGAAFLFVISTTLCTLLAYGSHTRLAHSTLVGIVFGIVPFLPASMIFTTVGTLVAERLLYLPSVGYCILCAVLVDYIMSHLGSVSVHKSTTVQPQVDKKPTSIKASKYCVSPHVLLGSVGAILLLGMTWRTYTRGLDWKSDATLFESAVRVCPDSAKLNGLYGQVLLNNQNFTGARHFFARAHQIHPEFCDLDHQRARLEIANGNFQNATELLTQNLQCAYTAEQSLSVLEKIWSARLNSDTSPNNTATVSLEVAQAMQSINNSKLAAEQFIEAAKAFAHMPKGRGKKRALFYARKAEKLNPVACDVSLNAARVKLSVGLRDDEIFDGLLGVIRSDCGNEAYAAADLLGGFFAEKLQVEGLDANQTAYLARKVAITFEAVHTVYSTAAVHSLSQTEKDQVILNPAVLPSLLNSTTELSSTASAAVRYWISAAQKFHEIQSLYDVLVCYSEAVRWGIKSPAEHPSRGYVPCDVLLVMANVFEEYMKATAIESRTTLRLHHQLLYSATSCPSTEALATSLLRVKRAANSFVSIPVQADGSGQGVGLEQHLDSHSLSLQTLVSGVLVASTRMLSIHSQGQGQGQIKLGQASATALLEPHLWKTWELLSQK